MDETEMTDPQTEPAPETPIEKMNSQERRQQCQVEVEAVLKKFRCLQLVYLHSETADSGVVLQYPTITVRPL